MNTRTFLLLAAIACLTAPSATQAQTTVYDTSGATIVCTTLFGTVSPKPLLTLTPQPMALTVKGRFSGCTVMGAVPADPPLQVVSGKMTAKLAVNGDASCATLIGGFQVTGDFVVKWKAAPGQALDHTSSTFAPDATGLVAGLVPLGLTTYGSFTTMGTLAPDSAFAGTTPGLYLVSAEDIYTMLGQCCTDAGSCSPVGEGIQKLHFSIGQVQL